MGANMMPPLLKQTLEHMGEQIAKSKFFSCENEHQGQVIWVSCFTTGRDILSIPQEYHLMNGKLSLRSDAMLGRLVKAGGSYEIVQRSPNEAAIRLKLGDRTHSDSLTWEDARKEPFVYQGKPKDIIGKLLAGQADKLMLSPNYATPRRRMQHLWARVVSDSMRAVAPHLITGSYTPEEVADFSGLESPVSESLPDVVDATDVERVQDTKARETQPDAAGGSVVANDDQSSEQASESVASGENTETIIGEVKSLAVQLKLKPESLKAAVQKRGGNKLADLSMEKAIDLRDALKARLPATEHPKQALDGPMPPELRTSIVQMMQKVAQDVGGAEITGRVKEALQAKGLKLADLTFEQGRKLLAALEVKEIEQFVEKDLAQVGKSFESDGVPH